MVLRLLLLVMMQQLGTQPQEVLDGIYMLGTLVPGIFYGIIAVLLFMYPLNKKKTIQLGKDLEAKRNAN